MIIPDWRTNRAYDTIGIHGSRVTEKPRAYTKTRRTCPVASCNGVILKRGKAQLSQGSARLLPGCPRDPNVTGRARLLPGRCARP